MLILFFQYRTQPSIKMAHSTHTGDPIAQLIREFLYKLLLYTETFHLKLMDIKI